MVDDPLAAVFGGSAAPADPFSDVFGTHKPSGDLSFDARKPAAATPLTTAFGVTAREPDPVNMDVTAAPDLTLGQRNIGRNRLDAAAKAEEERQAALKRAANDEAGSMAFGPRPALELAMGVKSAWASTIASMSANRTDLDSVFGKTSAEDAAAADVNRQKAADEIASAPDGPFSWFGQQVGMLAGSYYSMGKEAAKSAAVGGAAGAAIGGVAGGPVGAIGGAVAGAGAGFEAGFMADSFRTNAGQIEGDLDQARGPNGGTVDPMYSHQAALFGGSAMAALDMVGLHFLAKPFTGLIRKQVADELVKELAQGAFKRAGKAYLGTIASESITEGLQQGVQDASEDLAKKYTADDFKTIFNDPARRVEVVKDVVQTIVSTAVGMSAIGVPGAVAASRNPNAGPIVGDQQGVTEPVAPAAPEAKVDVPLTPADVASPIPNEVIQSGKNILRDALNAPTSPVASPTVDSRAVVKAKIRQIESSGNDQAHSKTSSASGRYQFTDATWTALGGDPAKRNDPGEQERLMDRLLNQNETQLKRGGAAITPGNLYLAHFLGAGGALNALAHPNELVNEAVQAANPHTRGWTNSQLAVWASQKMGGAAGITGDGTAVPTVDAPQIEATRDKLKRILGEDVTDFASGQRVDVTQNDTTVPGTVKEVYGQGDQQGVRIQRDDGTSFDEIVKQARDYGAKITHPVDLAAPVETAAAAPGGVPDVAQPITPAPRIVQDGFTSPQDASKWAVDKGLTGAAGRVTGNGDGTYSVIDETQTTGPIAPTAAPVAAFDPAQHVPALREIVKNSNVSLSNVGAIAKQLNIDEKQAHAVMGALASQPGSGFYMTKGSPAKYGPRLPSGRRKLIRAAVAPRLQRQARRTKPLSAMEFVRSIGGVAPGRHDLRNVGALARHPGVINKNGRPVDEVGRALHEAGYFPHDPANPDNRPTEAETIAFLDHASDKPAFAVGDQPAPAEDHPSEDAKRAAIEEEVSALGGAINDEEMADAIRHLDNGLSVPDAVEAALNDAAARELETLADHTGDNEYRGGMEAIYETGNAQESGRPAQEGVAGSPSDSGNAQGSNTPDAQPAQTGSTAPTESVAPAASGARLETTPSGKGVALIGASEAEKQAVADALGDKSRAVPRADGALVFSAKHEVRIRAALAKVAGEIPAAPTDAPATDLLGQPIAQPAVKPAAASDTQTDMFGTRPGDQRTALERQSEGRMKADTAQKAPGSDGGLFNPADTTGDLTAAPVKGSGTRDGAAWQPNTPAGISLAEAFSILRDNAAAKPVMELDGTTPTGWVQIPMTNGDGAFLVHTTRDEGREFTGKGWRQYAPAYAMDHVTPPNPLWNRSPETASRGGRSALIEQMPGQRTNKEYVGQGFNAGLAGFTVADDPYIPTSTASDNWRKGVRDAINNPPQQPAGPRVFVNQVGRDGLTDAERGGPLAPSNASPAGVDASRAAGQEAFDKGQQRVPPGYLFDAEHKKAWLAGWDQANLAAPVGDATPQVAAAAPGKSSNFGANNKRISVGKAAELRALVRSKIRSPKDLAGDTSGSIDTELLSAGLQLADFYIEGGIRKFGDFAKQLAADLRMNLSELKPYLRAWYNGARDTLEDQGEDVSDMDGPGAVRAAVSMIEASAPVPVDGIVNPEENTNAGPAVTSATQGDNLGSDAASNPQGTGSVGDAGQDSERPSGASAGVIPGGLFEGDGTRQPGEPQPVASGSGQRSDAGTGRSGKGSPVPSRRVRGKPADRGANFLAPAGGLSRAGSWRDTANRNLDIIELVNKLEAEGRPATPAEQALLARYTGWGASEMRNKLFSSVDRTSGRINQPVYAGEWGPTIERARELIQGDDLKVAMQSTQYAHYTSEGVVRSIWNGLARMGFEGGRLLEPGMGIGNFFTAAPADAMEHSSYTGIELDNFTARIAKLLLPQENVINGDFTRQALPDGFFDAAIGNPPFSSTKVLDDPAYKKHRFSLHDYFFAKSIDKVRPGGLLTFITSRYTMDKLDPKARQYIADKADFLGAIRLPQTAFKENAGTEVVTDVLFFQRRAPGVEPMSDRMAALDKISKPQGPEYRITSPLGTTTVNSVENVRREVLRAAQSLGTYNDHYDAVLKFERGSAQFGEIGVEYGPPARAPGGETWTGTQQITVGGVKVAINEYFARHPEMVLGKHATQRGQFGPNDYTVEPYAAGSIESRFAKAIEALPQNIYTEQPRESSATLSAKTYERDFAPASSKEGGLYVKDGKVLVVDAGSGVPVESINPKLKPADHAWLRDYAPLRDALKAAQHDQLGDGEWEKSHTALIKAYRAFTKTHGRIREFTPYDRTTVDEEGVSTTLTYRRFKWDNLLSLDVEGPLVSQLERITDAGDIIDGPFLQGRTLNKPTRPQIETAGDALAVALDEIGKLDLEYVAKLAGKTRDEVIGLLGDGIFHTPAGEWQTADEYLSGDVVKKLEEARAAAATEPALERNVKALEGAQPAPLAYSNITVKLGAPWIRPETVAEFAGEVLGFSGLGIKYESANAHWSVDGANQRWRRSAAADFGTQDRSAVELLEAILNNRSIKVMTPKTKDEGPKVDPTATAAAVEAARKISERFKTWLWEDSGRTGEYVATYNRSYNNLAPRRFDGSHLTLPGLSSRYTLHPHQKRAVWRIIQTGNTYLAHAVGAGKTLEMIVGGMEQRRLGLVKKPMYVVPNHMLNQFGHEFLEAYPAANIMVADEKAFHTGNRRRFLAQVALNDPDAIILTHSSFGKIEASDAAKKAVLDDMIHELEAAMQDAKDGDAPRHTVSKLEKQIEQLTRRFTGSQGTGKDKLLTFDEMGVDQLFIDEAHEFRKLDFATNRVAKGIDSSGSARAMDLFIKSRWLEKRNPGRSMIMASGTPVTNTMAELYTVMRYMALDALDRDHIKAFDAWANMFGEVVGGYEQNAAGGYEIVERFAKFVNVPELMKRAREFMDVLTSEQLGDLVQRPKVNGGVPHSAVSPASDELEQYMKQTLDTRLKISRDWKPSKEQPGNPDPVINIITDARLASIDLRFVTPGRKPDMTNKLNSMIAKIAETHNATANIEYADKNGGKQVRKGATQIVFSAVGFGDQVAANRGFDARGWINDELHRLGVKPGEIGWMADANSHAKKEQLQKDVRSGKVRILIGSPKNMGTGINVQDRLKALHYLSPPWYPADVEQPHGRIIRQGNLNPDVDLYWYATKGTYDSTAWGMVSRKQKFIEQAMSGDESVRVLDDISEASQYEMAAALAAGDERIIQVAGLSGDIERLQRLKGAHADTQRTLRSEVDTLRNFEMPRLQQRIAGLEAADKARGPSYQPFTATVGGTNYDTHGKAGQAMIDAAQAVIDNNVAIPRTEIGKLYGTIPVFIAPNDRLGREAMQFEMDVGGTVIPVGERFNTLEGKDSVGTARSFELAVQKIPSQLQEAKRNLAGFETQAATNEKKIGGPFPEEGQLAEKIAERGQLQAEIAAETATKDANKAKASAVDSAGGGRPEIFTPEQTDRIKAEAAAQLARLLPGDRVALKFASQINDGGQRSLGTYWNRVIKLATNVDSNKPWVMAHESVHAMKAMGLFTPTEWRLLVDSATKGREGEARWARVQKQWNDRGLDEAGLHEEAVAELFGEHADFMGELGKTFVGRMVKRVFNFLAAIARAVHKIRGDQGSIDHIDALRVMQSMERGEVGSRPLEFGEPARDRPARPESDFKVTFGNKGGPLSSAPPGALTPASHEFEAATEARWQDARKGVGDGAGVVEKAREWWADLTNGFTRHWKDLPNEPRFSDIAQQFRKLEAAPDAAMEASVRQLKTIVGNMDKAEYDLFSRKVVLDDLSWDAGEGRDLPFNFTPSTLVDARRAVDQNVNLNPKLVAAVRARKAYNQQIADEMVAAGVLTRDQIKNPAYFRHMVLDYVRHESALAKEQAKLPSSQRKIRSPYWAKRMGSTLDINANFLEAELDWLQKAQIDIATAKTIEWVKNSAHNTREDLRQKARDSNKQLLAEVFSRDPEAAQEDALFRQGMGHGFSIVAKAIESGDIGDIPAHLMESAAAVVSKSKEGDSPFGLLAWILDNDRAGSIGAAMVLKAAGMRKQLAHRLLGDKYSDPNNITDLVSRFGPVGATAWQPIEGQHMFTAKTITQSSIDQMTVRIADKESAELDRAVMGSALGSIKDQLVVGGDRYTMVLPNEVAATLNEFGDRRGKGMIARVAAKTLGGWKVWQLINPRRFLKYNINNMSGDLDAVLAGNPGTLRKVSRAWTMLRDARKGKVDPLYTEALERGVFGSGLTVQEIPDINRLSALRHLQDGPSARPDKLAIVAVAKVWHALSGSTQFRENLFRLAAYIDYHEKITNGQPMLKIGYGASVPNMVDAVSDSRDKAALLARDLIGDYGAISVWGSGIRQYAIPFWSWTEINTKRYWRLTSNVYSQSKARGLATGGLLGAGVAARVGVSLAIRMGLVYGLLYAWNNLLWPDEEKKLGEQQRKQLHLILGEDSDGKVMTLRLQGALSDVFSEFGLPDAVAALKKYQDGQGSIGQVATSIMKAPANRLAGGLTPFAMEPLAYITGKELWPDAFNPRTIHDSWRHAAKTFSLENEYDQFADKPSRGYGRSWTESLIYRRDPAEMAYDDAKGIAYDWLARTKGQEGGGATSSRGEALRDYRMALRYGDASAADKALLHYADLGGTEKSLKQSTARQHPLGPIAKKDRAAFLDSLTDEQLQTFADAESFWKDIYVDKNAVAPAPDSSPE